MCSTRSRSIINVSREVSKELGMAYNSTMSVFRNSYEYVFSTVPVSQIQDEFYFSLKRCVVSLLESAHSLLYVILYLALIVAKLAILVFPHAVNVGKVVVDYHRTKLSASDLLLEGTSIIVLLASFIFRRRIQRAYTKFINFISAKSKVPCCIPESIITIFKMV